MRSVATLLLIALAGLAPRLEARSERPETYAALRNLMDSSRSVRRQGRDLLIAEADPGWVPALVDAVFFTPRHARVELFDVLEELTGQRYRDYYDWVRYVGSHSDIETRTGYLGWKQQLLSRIDPLYERILFPGAPVAIRLEEVVWGGVPVGGIPALDRPRTIMGSEAEYLRRNELVLGLVLGGEARAYPLRIVSWHELVNDEVGSESIVLSFCTLCGSGIFYVARDASGAALDFDTSGLLYRSNKLMVDRQTGTLWSNLTGAPVVGRSVETEPPLVMLPGTLTTWQSWIEQNPQTTVLDLGAIRSEFAGRFNFDYRPGAADRARRGVSFPVWLESSDLPRDGEIFAIRLEGKSKAYSIEPLLKVRVLNDDLAGRPVVLVADSSSGAVRAYHRGELEFRATADADLVDSAGRVWQAEESALVPRQPDFAGESLARIPGHVVLWFGWYAFFPETEIWKG